MTIDARPGRRPRSKPPAADDPGAHIKPNGSDRVLNWVLLVVLAFFAVSVLYPLVYIVSASVSSPDAVSSGAMWLWPVDFSVESYRALMEYPSIPRGFLNSLLYAGSTMILATAITAMGGYALSRRDLPGRGWIMFAFLFTMLFSGGMIPTYLVVRQLGLLNTPWVMILPSLVSVWQLIVTRTFYQFTIPDELLETSRIDGASDFSFFFRVVLPLSKPVIAVNLLLYGVGAWNAYFNALIYLTNSDLYPIQLVMRNILIQNQFDPSKMANADPARIAEMQRLAAQLKYALIVIASIPPLIAYPFVQKHFVKGMMVGSVKG